MLEELEGRGRSVGRHGFVETRERRDERFESGLLGRVEVGRIFGEIEREGEGLDFAEIGDKRV